MEKEIQNLHQKVAEMSLELDLKVSGDSAREAVLQDQISYLTQRVEQLETELDEKEKAFETVQSTRNAMEDETKETIATMTSKENSLSQRIAQQEQEILQLKSDIENFTKNDTGSQDVIKSKDNEINKLREISQTLEANLQQLRSELEKQSSELSSRNEEALSLQKLISTEKATVDSQNVLIEEHVTALQLKNTEIVDFKKQVDARSLEIVELKFEIESLKQNAIKKSEESSDRAREIEEELNRKVTELSESKAKLENDLTIKDNEVQNVKVQIEKLQGANEDMQKCMSGLNMEAEKNLNAINEKNSTIDKLTGELNELKERNQNIVNELQAMKCHLEEQISVNHKSSDEQLQKLKLDYENEKSKLSSSNEELNAIIREKEARIDVMNKNSSLLTEKKEELEARLNELETKCSDSLTKLTKIEKDDSDKVRKF